MLKSMTGYGWGESGIHGKIFTVELKAVNHRYSEVVPRLPRSLSTLEDRIKRLIQSRVARGRVDAFLNMQDSDEKVSAVKVDKELAGAYYKAIKELQETLGIDGNINIKNLVELPGVLTLADPAENVEEWWPAVLEALESALTGLVQMRADEGKQLAADLIKRLDRITSLNVKIRERSPVVVEEYRERLGVRLNDFLKDSGLAPERLTAEAALFAERSNITEETVRLASHLKQALSCLQADEPVGRKLDFIIQEMNREINTIASKANDLEISHWAVEVKSELEKIREQVQNIE
ncbi:MAG: YicC family protein [Firmicutes bacterium]|nr:YicC family protein [Bacillota bacterium]